MKKIILLTALSLVLPPVYAQQSPNREGIGDVPNAFPGAALSAPNNPPGADEGEKESHITPDERFLRKAGKAGRVEVTIAEMATTKATREDLKAFAGTVVTEHSAANMELAEIARSLGMEIPDQSRGKENIKSEHATPLNNPSGQQPAENIPKDPVRQSAADKHQALKEKTGMEFDTAFMEVMEDCHTKDVAIYEKARGEVKAPELKGFVEKMLPILEKHSVALAALKRKDPSRPDARTGSPAKSPAGIPEVRR